jgi:hypothetical protein
MFPSRSIVNGNPWFGAAKSLAVLFLLIAISSGAMAQSSGTHAALAIDRKDGSLYGWAVDFDSAGAAEQRAKDECLQRGGTCHIVLRFKGGCGAYAVERGNNSLYGWGTADSRSAAEARALQEARERGGTDLVIRVWGCNSGELEVAEEESSEQITGVTYLYMTKMHWGEGLTGNCYISRVMYLPNAARLFNGKWELLPGKEEELYRLDPVFEAKIVELIPSGESYQLNEYVLANEGMGRSPEVRRGVLEHVRESFINKCTGDDYMVTEVDL